MRTLTQIFVCAVLICALTTGTASAERRVALVIGNSDYAHASSLPNPKHDATDMSRALEGLGFDVLTALDLNAKGFLDTYDAFEAKLQDADVALFYYAGHGMQFRSENYLVAVDAKLENEFALRREAFSLTSFVELMERHATVNLAFVDACRDNPLASRLFRSLSRTRSGGATRGLSPMPQRDAETLVVYATAPNDVAADGTGKNSPFTQAMLNNMTTERLEVEVMLKRVTREVLVETDGKQKPERVSGLATEFYFAGNAPDVTSGTKEQHLVLQNLAAEIVTPDHSSVAKRLGAAMLPETVALSGGVFRMGCRGGDTCRADELPVHQVELKPFDMSRYETTFAQWDLCVADGGCRKVRDDEGWGRGQRPVINVSWVDANNYTRWLSEKTGQTWRLPTEAEWEYAARAGAETAFATGAKLKPGDANVGRQHEGTRPVGQYTPNAFGLHDMHGNVWEWVADAYRRDAYRQRDLEDATVDTSATTVRVNRGGGWHYDATYARAAMRARQKSDATRSNLGFRVVREQ